MFEILEQTTSIKSNTGRYLILFIYIYKTSSIIFLEWKPANTNISQKLNYKEKENRLSD